MQILFGEYLAIKRSTIHEGTISKPMYLEYIVRVLLSILDTHAGKKKAKMCHFKMHVDSCIKSHELELETDPK